jgi:hypothetical protein
MVNALCNNITDSKNEEISRRQPPMSPNKKRLGSLVAAFAAAAALSACGGGTDASQAPSQTPPKAALHFAKVVQHPNEKKQGNKSAQQSAQKGAKKGAHKNAKKGAKKGVKKGGKKGAKKGGKKHGHKKGHRGTVTIRGKALGKLRGGGKIANGSICTVNTRWVRLNSGKKIQVTVAYFFNKVRVRHGHLTHPRVFGSPDLATYKMGLALKHGGKIKVRIKPKYNVPQRSGCRKVYKQVKNLVVGGISYKYR